MELEKKDKLDITRALIPRQWVGIFGGSPKRDGKIRE